MKNKKLIFITGATGTMGAATVKAFLKASNRFRLRILVLNTIKYIISVYMLIQFIFS